MTVLPATPPGDGVALSVGFTGTQQGMTWQQMLSVGKVLHHLWHESVMVLDRGPGVSYLHHGDCVGADAQAHALAVTAHFRTWGHPPSNEGRRAWTPFDRAEEPMPYLVRNRAIVDASEVLVATPGGPEQVRSGTWSTIRYAGKVGRPVFVFMPDGSRYVPPA